MTTLAAFDDFLDSVPQPAAGPPGSQPPAATPAAKMLLELGNVALSCAAAEPPPGAAAHFQSAFGDALEANDGSPRGAAV